MDIRNFVHNSFYNNEDLDSLYLTSFKDIVAKNWNSKHTRIFNDLESISDIEETDFYIFPQLADYTSESCIPLKKSHSNRFKNENKKLEILKHFFKSFKKNNIRYH